MLFISKKVVNQSFIDFISKNNIEMVDQSLIDFEAIDFKCPSHDRFEIVFFTSPRSVYFYLSQCGLSADHQIATIGESTAEYIREKGHSVDFYTANSGHPDKVGKEFSAFANGKTVLFPQSNRSHRSMQKQLDHHQILDLLVYTTVLQPQQLNVSPTILAFTSPTNAESYLLKNKIDKNQLVIAWGKTTASFLKAAGISSNHVLKTASFEELQRVLETYY